MNWDEKITDIEIDGGTGCTGFGAYTISFRYDDMFLLTFEIVGDLLGGDFYFNPAEDCCSNPTLDINESSNYESFKKYLIEKVKNHEQNNAMISPPQS